MISLLALVPLALPQSQNIMDYVSSNLKDASLVASIVTANQVELKKINDDFGLSYRFDSSFFQMKEPFMLKITAKVEDTSIIYILDGPMLHSVIPKLKINRKEDLSTKPGRRQTWMDIGVLTPSLFAGNFFTAKFVRDDRATGDVVFDITYVKSLDDTSRHRVWIDPQKKYVARREWYNQYNRQLATFYYDNPKEFDGVWLPTQLTVKNVDNKVAGVTRYDSIKINSGIPDSAFSS